MYKSYQKNLPANPVSRSGIATHPNFGTSEPAVNAVVRFLNQKVGEAIASVNWQTQTSFYPMQI